MRVKWVEVGVSDGVFYEIIWVFGVSIIFKDVIVCFSCFYWSCGVVLVVCILVWICGCFCNKFGKIDYYFVNFYFIIGW